MTAFEWVLVSWGIGLVVFVWLLVGGWRARIERALHPGFGTCYCCERPWPCVEPHDTCYEANRACFPLCERCWRRLGTPAARLPYYERMWMCWFLGAPSPEEQVRLLAARPRIRQAVLVGR